MKVQGYCSTPAIDHARDMVLPTAFDDSLRERGIRGPRGVKFLAQHDYHKPIGALTKLEPRNGGLWLEAEIDEGISYASDLAKAVTANGGLSFSIGYRLIPGQIELIEEGDASYFKIHKLDLFEVSIVTFPANEECVMELPLPPAEQIQKHLARMKEAADPYERTRRAIQKMKEAL